MKENHRICEKSLSSLFDIPIDPVEKHSDKFKNLSIGCPSYGYFLKKLSDSGWIRFAVGFKSGVYCHPLKTKWCIKIIGMGIGDDPYYFCGRGYYLRHEKEMLLSLRNKGFDFQPNVMSDEDSISFLFENCDTAEKEAKRLVENKDILIIEYISGVTIASRTGYNLDYEVSLPVNEEFLRKTFIALHYLKQELTRANQIGLMHNDPMPDNIILTLDNSDNAFNIRARLVDFELAKDLSHSSPNYVEDTVNELYKERDVPLNHQTHKYKKSLDQHLMDGSIELVKEFIDYIAIIKSPSGDRYDKSPSMVATGSSGGIYIFNPANVSVETQMNNLYINMNQGFTQVADQIQDLVEQLKNQGIPADDAQNRVAQCIANQAQQNPGLSDKLRRWAQSLGEATVSDMAKAVIKLAIRSAGIAL